MADKPIRKSIDRWHCCHLDGTPEHPEESNEHGGPLFELTLGPGLEDNTQMCLDHLSRHINRDDTTQINPLFNIETGDRIFPGDPYVA